MRKKVNKYLRMAKKNLNTILLILILITQLMVILKTQMVEVKVPKYNKSR